MLPSITRSTFRPFFPSLFDDDFFSSVPAGRMNTHMPAVNIREDEKNYFLELAVPGIDKKDLKIDIDEDVLTISSEHKNEVEDKQEGYTRKEFSYSSFARSFYIPENVNKDDIQANCKDGILTVSFPKQAEDKQKITKEVKIS
ncbi:MAG TPA: Hsp20/alpha crystallin family protein [Bacteroidales bacterium]|jgi:HSP20 family protein|nr:Hsp20/alpha crystallin family protein [Bacteroidales bacterium]